MKTNLQRQIEALDENAPFYAERVAAAQELTRQKRREIDDKWDLEEDNKKLEADELAFATDQNILNERLLNRQITEEQFLTASD